MELVGASNDFLVGTADDPKGLFRFSPSVWEINGAILIGIPLLNSLSSALFRTSSSETKGFG